MLKYHPVAMLNKYKEPVYIDLDAMPVPLLLIDQDYKVVYMNRVAKELYGASAEGNKCYSTRSIVCPVQIIKESGVNSASAINICDTEFGKRYFYIIAGNYKDRKLFVEVHIDLEDLTKALTQSAIHPELMLHSGPMVFFHWDAVEGWPLKFVSLNVSELLGYTAGDFLEGRVQYRDIIHPEDLDRVVSEVQYHTESGSTEWNHEEYRLRRKDGKYIWVYDHTVAIRNAEGKVIGYYGYVIDITEKHEKEELFRKLTEANPHAVLLYDYEKNKIVYVNKKAQELTEYTEEELLSMDDPFNLVYPKDMGAATKIVEERIKGYQDIQKARFRIVTKRGKTKWVDFYSIPTIYKNRKVNITTLVDISEDINRERMLAHLATRDQLTGILNRHALTQSFEQLINQVERYGGTFSIILFDLDNFKKVNDIYGHNVGDEVLRRFVKEARKVLRRSDIFGRWGGEEFLVLLPMTSEPYTVAEKIRRVIEECQFYKNIRITISAGTAVYRKGDTLNSMVMRADDALYKAKAQGKNRVVTSE